MAEQASTAAPIAVSEVRIRMAEGVRAGEGPLAWASCVVNGAILLNNIAIYRGRNGELKTKFPYKSGRAGQKYYHCCPITHGAKALIDEAILRGFAP